MKRNQRSRTTRALAPSSRTVEHLELPSVRPVRTTKRSLAGYVGGHAWRRNRFMFQ